MIKPASSLCDLRCRYCFYHDVSEQRRVKNFGMMETDTAEHIIIKALDEAKEACCFAFQGGEPFLRGLDFYVRFVSFVRANNKKHLNISYAIQTNGMHLTREWAGFLRENRFLVGISLDGPAELHNRLRVTETGKGTYTKVKAACTLLSAYGVPYNILCVVTSLSARYGMKLYEFFKKQGFSHIQFIPCIEPADQDRGEHALTADAYGGFLKTVFDLWYSDWKSGNYVSIRHIDNYLAALAGQGPELCSMRPCCGCQFAVEADGSVYPCDFYMTDSWYLGNIRESTWSSLGNSNKAGHFIRSSGVGGQCLGCRWQLLCQGGCRRDRVEGKNVFCASYKEFFAYSIERLVQAATGTR